jgi:hypothetical protein
MDAIKQKKSRTPTTERLNTTRVLVKRHYDERGGKYVKAIKYYTDKHPELLAMQLLTSEEDERLSKIERLRLKATRVKEYHINQKLKAF